MRAAKLLPSILLAGFVLASADCSYLFPSCATVPGCPAGQRLCDNLSCANVATDPLHCGFCDNKCSPGLVCVPTGENPDGGHGGVCGCPIPGQLLVEGRCVDPRVDPRNCGTVGHICRGDQACLDGGCGCPFASYLNDGGAECSTDAGPLCTDLGNDPANCGVCGLVCDGLCKLGECADAGSGDAGLDDGGPQDAGDGGGVEPGDGGDGGAQASDGGDGG